MWATRTWFQQAANVCAGVCMLAFLATTTASESKAATPEKPVAGKQIQFPNGTWSALPQTGPDGKVRQCVLVAMRPRAGPAGAVDTRLIIGRGAGLTFVITDDKVPSEDILDDEGELVLNDHAFPADAFTDGSNSLVLHPGNASGALSALAKTVTLRLHSAGAGVDTGAIALDLPSDALAWLTQCGKQFDIAIDRPTDPNAPALPVPRSPSPAIASGQATAAGPAGIEDKQKIGGWDASELRNGDGTVGVCFIRQHYAAGSDPGARSFATFLAVSGTKGLSLVLKDSGLNLPPNQPVDQATLAINSKPFVGFSAHVLGNDEIGVFPQSGAALMVALGDGVSVAFKSLVEGMDFPVPSGVVPWLRACARRWNFSFEQPQPTP
jgi:hypothetical protein